MRWASTLTRRDLQAELKKMGRSWEPAKAFEDGAPCSSALVPASRIGHPAAGRISLTVNGALKQQGDLNQMIWKVPEIIATLSTLFRLAPGDLIFTGTPGRGGAHRPRRPAGRGGGGRRHPRHPLRLTGAAPGRPPIAGNPTRHRPGTDGLT